MVETERVLRYIFSRRPHPVKEMLAIAESREMILNLAQPLADIINAIQQRQTAIVQQDVQENDVPFVDLKRFHLRARIKSVHQPTARPP